MTSSIDIIAQNIRNFCDCPCMHVCITLQSRLVGIRNVCNVLNLVYSYTRSNHQNLEQVNMRGNAYNIVTCYNYIIPDIYITGRKI